MKRSCVSIVGGISLLLAMTACAPAEKDYGFGKCEDYVPSCLLGGVRQCRINAQGCQDCTCVGGRPWK